MSFFDVVRKIRTERGLTREIPAFDPENGNESAKFLFLMEAPGPKALDSGYISFDNPDPSARNLKSQLEIAGISRSEIALWNVVPWYIGNGKGTAIRAAAGQDVRAGIEYLAPLISEMPNLRCIVLVGSAARKAHVFLSLTTPARIVSCHHTSAKVHNTNTNATRENIDVLRFIRSTT